MRRRKACIVLTVLTIGSIVTASFSALAQEKARIGWTGINPAASPIWVVHEKGLLKKVGVNAEIINISSSPIAMQALLAGELDVIVSSVTTLVTSRLAGADTIMIQTLVPTFVDHIVSLSSITDLRQLIGKTGGVNRSGSTSDLGLRLALRGSASIPKRTPILLLPVTLQRDWRPCRGDSCSSQSCLSRLFKKLRSSAFAICWTPVRSVSHFIGMQC